MVDMEDYAAPITLIKRTILIWKSAFEIRFLSGHKYWSPAPMVNTQLSQPREKQIYVFILSSIVKLKSKIILQWYDCHLFPLAQKLNRMNKATGILTFEASCVLGFLLPYLAINYHQHCSRQLLCYRRSKCELIITQKAKAQLSFRTRPQI